MNIPPPVKPPPRPGQVKVYKALYEYKAQRDDELSFNEGDLLYMIDMITHKDWWKAKLNNGKVGLVPCNYIEENTENLLNPLHEACKRGNIGFLKECLMNKVSVNSLDKAGNTPLHWACYGGHFDCVKLLLNEASIALNVQNKLGDTPLHNAAYKGYSEIIKILIENGSRLTILNMDSKIPYECALDTQCKALLQVNKQKQEELNEDYMNNQNDDDDANDSD